MRAVGGGMLVTPSIRGRQSSSTCGPVIAAHPPRRHAAGRAAR